MTISGTHPYYDGYEPWEDYQSDIQSVVIEKGITYVPEGAFAGCKKLEKVNIPSSVKSIRDKAFWGCSNLTAVTIPDGVTSIGEMAFAETGLVRIVIPDSVTSIGLRSFSKCGSLTEAVLPKPVSNYVGTGYSTFAEFGRLAKVTIPDGITRINHGTFSGCSSLQSVSIPASLEVLGTPTPASNVSCTPFGECFKLDDIQVVSQSGKFCCEDGILYSKDKTELYFCTNKRADTSFTVPNDVVKIWKGAFSACDGLKNLKIPAQVTSMEDHAVFGMSMYCPGLASIEVDSKNPNYCSENGVLYSKDKTTLEMYPAKKSGSSFIVPDGVKTIGKSVFNGSAVKNVTFPKSVETIESEAFSGAMFASTTFLNPSCDISPEAYWGFKGGYEVVIYGYSASTAEDFAKRAGVTFKVVGSESNNQKPTTKPMPKPITKPTPKPVSKPTSKPLAGGGTQTSKPLAAGAGFTDAASSGKYKVTGASSSNPTVAYAGPANSGAKSISIPDSITYQRVTYRVTSVEAKAFKGNKNITSVKMGSKITKIGDSAFENCSKLKSVTVGSGVTSIGKNTWKGCRNLKTITVKSKKLGSVGKNALKSIHKKCKIKVPVSKVKAYKKNFKGKGQAKSVEIK